MCRIYEKNSITYTTGVNPLFSQACPAYDVTKEEFAKGDVCVG
jgi:hypothetical protein